MYQLVMLLLIILSTPPGPDAGRGDLTVIVRDREGQRLPHVLVALIHDADDGRVLISEQRTDVAGEIRYRDLPWGLYIVQFRGTLGQQPVLPPDRQNLGLLDDGTGASGGFGVRFAEAERTELFVLTSVPGEAHAVPMFDLAPSVQATPEPLDPLLAMASPTPEPVPSHAPRPSQGSALAWRVLLLGAGSILLALLVGLWRSRQARKEAE